jgi:RNA polymerase sigma-70 factor, ECF subfamily
MTPSPISSEELAGHARSGCRASFEQLLRRYQTPVLHFLRRRGFAVDAEDLTQETFLRVYENIEQYQPGRSFAAWLFAIARHVSIDHHRRRVPPGGAVLETEPPPEAAASSARSPLDTMVAEESRGRLWQLAADALPERQWTALWLHYAENMTTHEIAAVLECSRASVKILMFRARKTLAPLMEKHEFIEGGHLAGELVVCEKTALG